MKDRGWQPSALIPREDLPPAGQSDSLQWLHLQALQQWSHGGHSLQRAPSQCGAWWGYHSRTLLVHAKLFQLRRSLRAWPRISELPCRLSLFLHQTPFAESDLYCGLKALTVYSCSLGPLSIFPKKSFVFLSWNVLCRGPEQTQREKP